MICFTFNDDATVFDATVTNHTLPIDFIYDRSQSSYFFLLLGKKTILLDDLLASLTYFLNQHPFFFLQSLYRQTRTLFL